MGGRNTGRDREPRSVAAGARAARCRRMEFHGRRAVASGPACRVVASAARRTGPGLRARCGDGRPPHGLVSLRAARFLWAPVVGHRAPRARGRGRPPLALASAAPGRHRSAADRPRCRAAVADSRGASHRRGSGGRVRVARVSAPSADRAPAASARDRRGRSRTAGGGEGRRHHRARWAGPRLQRPDPRVRPGLSRAAGREQWPADGSGRLAVRRGPHSGGGVEPGWIRPDRVVPPRGPAPVPGALAPGAPSYGWRFGRPAHRGLRGGRHRGRGAGPLLPNHLSRGRHAARGGAVRSPVRRR